MGVCNVASPTLAYSSYNSNAVEHRSTERPVELPLPHLHTALSGRLDDAALKLA